MNFLVAADTDIGLTKSTNQDSLSVKIINTNIGRMVFAIMCDGMGGLSDGEIASAAVVKAFGDWVSNELPKLCVGTIEDSEIRRQWGNLIVGLNETIKSYGGRKGVKLGTTATVLLLTQTRYYIAHVGDSRAYELGTYAHQITEDQTFVAREVANGNMTEEEAETDERRSVLLQCIGASEEVYPDFYFGDAQCDTVYMLCCDGFRHEISSDEIFSVLNPYYIQDESYMQSGLRTLINMNKERMERDNISVIAIKSF